eukprot:TRINITY_DN105268_c0_g1_i1.p1 TRINITY_DN105268_c0_g1~~TRINITY_DN105268_c0_g1_i1.p1  ORF type:complete len:628 (-),score=94.98 TRINITY_DN105268_c0_g1_i1:160-1998(-)
MAVARCAAMPWHVIFSLLSHCALSHISDSWQVLPRPGENIRRLVDLTAARHLSSYIKELASEADIDEAAMKLHSGSRRELQAICHPQMLSIYPPPTWSKFLNCTAEKFKTMNSSVVASEVAATADCWCQHNVKQTIMEYGCCGHKNFQDWCAIDCAADCASQAATQCYSKCPALCLEPDYAPESCKESCDSGQSRCYSYTRCIAAKAMQDTHAGDLSMVCDDQNFHKSNSLNDYETCLNANPSRTNWHRHNGKAHCACESGVKADLQKHNCCGADWAKGTCALKCETDCTTNEAKRCVETCRNSCHQLHPNLITKECVDMCFSNTSSCRKYETCAPNKTLLPYEYQCSDGSKPNSNGCCTDNSRLGQGCPQMCGIKRTYIINSKLECQCFDCPQSQEQQENAFKTMVLERIEQSGNLIMRDICSQVTLEKCPTEAMQQMLQDRDKDLEMHVAEYKGSKTSELENVMQVTSSKWSARILLEAHKTQDCASGALKPSECEADPAQGSAKTGEPGAPASDESNTTVIVVISVVAAVVTCGLAAALLVMYRRAKKPVEETGNNRVPIGPRDGDDQVVVGRPVTGETAPGDAEATFGAPVQVDEKAQDDPKNSANAV